MQKHSGQAPCEEDTSSRIGQVIIQYVEQAKDHLAIERNYESSLNGDVFTKW